MTMATRPLLTALLAALTLQACAVGPNYRRPDTPLPEAYRSDQAPQLESLADLPWWVVFQDDILQGLIAEALRNNYDLQTAVARVEQARGVLVSTRSAIFPQGGYQGDASRGREFFGFGSNRTFRLRGRSTCPGDRPLGPHPAATEGRADLWRRRRGAAW
jgi:multidrug efflux system outer membrane protein